MLLLAWAFSYGIFLEGNCCSDTGAVGWLQGGAKSTCFISPPTWGGLSTELPASCLQADSPTRWCRCTLPPPRWVLGMLFLLFP